jgi:hypothetical protein
VGHNALDKPSSSRWDAPFFSGSNLKPQTFKLLTPINFTNSTTLPTSSGKALLPSSVVAVVPDLYKPKPKPEQPQHLFTLGDLCTDRL